MPLATAFLERFATQYPEYRLIFPNKESPNHFMIVDKDDLYRWKKNEVDDFFSFKTKIIVKHDKPVKYWVLGMGALIPCAITILTAFKGPRPGGQVIHYKDGNRENCRLSNLEWKPKENKNGQITGISYDKGKKKWRITRAGFKRTCHSTREEAEQALIAQGLAVPVEEDEEEPEMIEQEELPEDEEMSPEEIAMNIRLDKQFEENEKRNKLKSESKVE
jgi:hypothetical protein